MEHIQHVTANLIAVVPAVTRGVRQFAGMSIWHVYASNDSGENKGAYEYGWGCEGTCRGVHRQHTYQKGHRTFGPCHFHFTGIGICDSFPHKRMQS